MNQLVLRGVVRHVTMTALLAAIIVGGAGFLAQSEANALVAESAGKVGGFFQASELFGVDNCYDISAPVLVRIMISTLTSEWVAVGLLEVDTCGRVESQLELKQVELKTIYASDPWRNVTKDEEAAV